MSDFAATNLEQPSAIEDSGVWLIRRRNTLLIVLAATALVTANAMSGAFYDGRLAAPMTHNDVNYFIDGIQHLTILRTQGFFALLSNFFHSNLHAPISTYQTVIAYLIFGVTDWAPYATNILYVIIFLGFGAYLVRDCPAVVLTAVMACLIAMPLSANTVMNFAPEMVCSLFTSIGVVLMVRLPLFDAPLRSRFHAGLWFGLGFLAHPVAFAFTTIALLSTIGLTFLRDIGWTCQPKKLQVGIVNSLVNTLLSIWLPALYMAPRFDEYWGYFYDALFNPATSWVWRTHLSGRQQLVEYLYGDGGRFMFDHKLWAYAGIIGLGILAVWWRGERPSLARQVQLLLLAFVFWLVPTLSPVKSNYFASTFGYSIAFMTVIALESIYGAMRGAFGTIVVTVLGFSLFISYQRVDWEIPNTPHTIVDREFAFSAIDRFKAVLVGNAVNDHGVKVYMTNVGAYAPNILQYYLLKADPTLDWTLDSRWMDTNVQDHLDLIHGSPRDYTSTPDFVIAGERGNGLTYSPIVWPIEDGLFAAMWHDPGFMAIDRFYGPLGRSIAIFERRGSFGGWRPISGLINRSGRRDDPRYSPGGLAYLQTFSARPIQADLEIEWVGKSSGQTLSVFVNNQKAAQLTFTIESETSSLKQQIDLSGGTNDIVLQSDGPVTLRHMLIVPHIVTKVPEQGISVAAATYGGNCGAPQGNATQDVASSCNDKTGCEYSVHFERLGDPARGCSKDFAVSYFCPSEATMRYNKLSGEAGIGKIVTLSCAQSGKD